MMEKNNKPTFIFFVEVRDFCHFETFNASCGNEAVILMQTAQYGRMRFGRCVDRDYGYVGCSASVLTEADIRLYIVSILEMNHSF